MGKVSVVAQSVFCSGAAIPLGIQPRSAYVSFFPSLAPGPAVFFLSVWGS